LKPWSGKWFSRTMQANGDRIMQTPYEMPETGQELNGETLPLFLLEDRVVLPGVVVPVAVTAACLRELTALGLSRNSAIVFACPPEPERDNWSGSLCCPVGVLARVIRFIRMGDAGGRLLVQGDSRVCLDAIRDHGHLTLCRVSKIDLPETQPEQTESARSDLYNHFLDYLQTEPSMSAELGEAAALFGCPGRLADFIASNLDLDLAGRRSLVPLSDPLARAGRVMELLSGKSQTLIGPGYSWNAGTAADQKPGDSVTRKRTVQEHEEDNPGEELDSLSRRIEAAGMSAEAEAVAWRELARLRRMNQSSAEYSQCRNWLEWLADMPWKAPLSDTADPELVKAALDSDHYGLEEVKQRIVEHLAVRRLRGADSGLVLCLSGPPGVGKTSLGQSIARALGRKFCRAPLGGVRDEAEIRGHRRTYVGALPGRIIQQIRRAGSRDPVMMLDEIDKLGGEGRSDPASALLEALDPAQNGCFTDHYLSVGFDLSRVLFITTANLACQIPQALLDRLEVIELPGYTASEKIRICRNHILPAQMIECGLNPGDLSISDTALGEIVDRYTREAGVRQLSREIAAICRKAALRKLRNESLPPVNAPDLAQLLGPPQFLPESPPAQDEVGVATALAWTSTGGEILLVEALRMEGSRGFELTGRLGEVMRESALASQSWLRANSSRFSAPGDFFSNCDIHLHVPSGGTPKDGPSAGLAITAALASLMTGRPVRSDTAMTGEITLRGKIMPVGGVREKIIAAHRAGLRRIVLPADNAPDLVHLPSEIAAEVSFITVSSVDAALEAVLLPARGPRRDK